MKVKSYENLRKLALIDAKRRLANVIELIPNWNIVERVHKNGDIEKSFSYKPTLSLLTKIDLNSYATIREIKYIVWRFDISKEELLTGVICDEKEITVEV